MRNDNHRKRTRSPATMLAGILLLAPGPVSALQTDSNVDERVTNALRAEDSALSNVSAKVHNGVIELHGTVDTLAAKYFAEQAVSTTGAARAIVNRIQVEGPDREASTIENDYREMLREEPATESFEIDVAASDGVLTLTGQVDSAAERQLAEMTARRVRGVSEIDNELRVRPAETARADAEIEEEIRSLLKWDARVDESLVAVSVRDGIVELAGVARSPREKTQAIVLSHVRGVKSVEAPELFVRIEDEDVPEARRASEPAGSDAEMAQALMKAIDADPRLPEKTLEVEVRDGVAYLSGEVGRLSSKHVAEEDAENVVGVVRVVNNIQVVDTANLSDEEIQRNVESAIGHDPLVDADDIEARVEDGVVTLTGTVLSDYERSRLVEATARARGVIGIDSEKLVVEISS